MRTIVISAAAIAAAATAAQAALPVSESPVAKKFVLRTNQNTWTEDFEGRPDSPGRSMQEWLPAGWEDVSKAGNKAPEPDALEWNITWQVNRNEYKNMHNPSVDVDAYEGEAFAFIMPDVAYGDYVDLKYQDEWLITPEVTPVGEDWLYFKLWYNAGWTVYNRESDSFDSLTNSLQVYVSADNGASWNLAWDLVEDQIRPNYSDSQLRAFLISTRHPYEPVYVDLKDYRGKPVRIAFRFYGSTGQPMALDNVAVGVPQPVASYTVPDGCFRQGVSTRFDYPSDARLLIPAGQELTWGNTSVDYLTCRWDFADAEGVTAVSDRRDLVTPAYGMLQTVQTPVLTALFETRESAPYTLSHTKMQAGGIIDGYDSDGSYGEASVGHYDIFDKGTRVSRTPVREGQGVYSLGAGLDLEWEKRLGKLDGALDVLGFGAYYPKPQTPYGFDFVDMPAYVLETLDDSARIEARVVSVTDEGLVSSLLGIAEISGADIPEADDRAVVNLRFRFPVPVYVQSAIMVVVSGLRDEGLPGVLQFPYLRTSNLSLPGNNYLIYSEYDPNTGEMNETLGNLQSVPMSGDEIFGGLMFGIGASYSFMTLDGDNSFEVPCTGGAKSFRVKALHTPDHWALTENGVTRSDWVDFNTEYDAADDSYLVTLNASANTDTEARDRIVTLVSPGSYVEFHLTQAVDPAGIDGVEGGQAAMKVTVEDGVITVSGASGVAEVYDLAGRSAASAVFVDGVARISADGLARGVYMVRAEGCQAVKIVL